MLISILHPNTQKRVMCFGSFRWRADRTSWIENCARMYKYSEEHKAQKSIFISGPNPNALCVFFFRTKAATSRFYLIGKISHAELREDQKVRDTGRGKALSWRASRQNQARRLRMCWLMCLKHTLCTRDAQIYCRHFDCICLLQFLVERTHSGGKTTIVWAKCCLFNQLILVIHCLFSFLKPKHLVKPTPLLVALADLGLLLFCLNGS